MLILWFALGLAAICLLISYGCYRMAYYVPPRKVRQTDEIEIPAGEVYEVHREKMENWARKMRAMPHEEFEITAFDGLKLHAKFYEYAPGAPIELMFHGYRGSAERDLSGGIERCFRVRRSALIVDQRCAGFSEGKTITFGINERRDCLKWIEFMIDHFGGDVKIILTGISMGAATVLMAGAEDLPPNVVGILADCGYTSAKEIILKVIRDMKYPALIYPFARLGGMIFGGFDVEEVSPMAALPHSRLPVLFFHGTDDDFVPHEMSIRNHKLCASRKKLVLVPDAGHGLAYPKDKESYYAAVHEFFDPILNKK
jgi:pimeloyl-ACP methyl ester carboxylesterase